MTTSQGNSPLKYRRNKKIASAVKDLTEEKIKSIALNCKTKGQFIFLVKQQHGNCG